MTKTRTLDDLIWSDAFWLWARIAFIMLCVAVGSAIGASGCGCTPTSSPARVASPSELRHVVALVAPHVEWREPALSADAFGQGGSAVQRWKSYCNAFAVRRGQDAIVLVTAQHCLAHAKLGLGDDVRYREPSGWGLGAARVVRVDEGRDYAELAPADTTELVPLEVGAAPHEGAYLTTTSAYFGERVSGRVYASAGGRVAFYGHVQYGWSGSPVLDAHGRAVGVVIQCVTEAGPSDACADGVIAGAL